MKRVGLKQVFHGEPDPAMEGAAASRNADRDQVTLQVNGGSVVYRVPTTAKDNEVIDDKFLATHIELNLELEDGVMLYIQISEDAQGVDARFAPRDTPQTG